jgi:predicted nucleic acid-binding protein
VLVLDASVAIAAVLPDEAAGNAARSVMDRVAVSGAVVPSLWRAEIVNVLLTGERRGRILEVRSRSITAHLAGLPISIDFEASLHAWEATINLGRKHRLTFYDSAYLELALRRKLPLASFDRALRRAGEAERVEILGDIP